MMKSSNLLFKAIMLSSPLYKEGSISKRIAKLFNLQLIHSADIEKKQLCSINDITPFIYEELNKNICRSWLLDGYPKNKDQAKLLWKEQKCHVALNLKIPINLVVSQANKERYIHPESGREYSLEFNPPLRDFKDDLTNEKLIRIDDYTDEELKRKIQDSEEDLRGLVEFYREVGILQEIHGYSTTDLINKARICLSCVLPDSIL